MRSSRVADEIQAPAEWLERLTVNVEVATIPEVDSSLLPTQWTADEAVLNKEKKNRKSPSLQRQNIEISRQIFPEKEYWVLSPNFHIHASVSDLYGLPIVLEEICRPILGLYKSLTDT
jgi:hypothetical protein